MDLCFFGLFLWYQHEISAFHFTMSLTQVLAKTSTAGYVVITIIFQAALGTNK